jgi:LuxR family maltose regulon positive regulatory protein
LQELHFPKLNYYLDESDPNIVILRRQDSSLVAVFSASGATRKGIVETAKKDYRELIRAQLSRAHPASLTERELVVLRLLGSELSTRQMAQSLYIAPETVRTHIGSIYRKLGVSSRKQAVEEAHARGLL